MTFCSFHLNNNVIKQIICFWKRIIFLRLYELRKEFSYLIKRGTNKNEVVHDLLRCVKERFNRFDIDKIYKREKKEEFQVIAIVYQPAKKI